jgi:hypothetical protein
VLDILFGYIYIFTSKQIVINECGSSPWLSTIANSNLDIDITFRYIRNKGYIVLYYWPTNMSIYVSIPIQKQLNYFKHSKLSVLSVLYLAWYSKQLNNGHSSVICQAKYNWLSTIANSNLDIDITFRYIRNKGYIVLYYWPTNMS